MSRLLQILIVITCLLPTSSTAQKPETEPIAALPAPFRTIRKVELSPEANSWAVQIISRGGIHGWGKGDLTITSQGNLGWIAHENQCNFKLGDDVVHTLTRAAFSTNVSGWGQPTASYCSDCIVYAIVLQRRESDGTERTYVAYWDDSTKKNISEELRNVYDTFMTHKGCNR